MFEIGLLAIIALIVVASRQQKRLNRIERELTALRGSLVAPAAAAAVDVPLTGAIGGGDTGKDAALSLSLIHI